MGAMPGTRPTGTALKAASVVGGPEVSTAAKAARQRQQIDAIKSRRPAPPAAIPPAAQPVGPPPASPGGGPPAALTDMRGAPSWYRKAASPDPVALGNAGGGFLLGLGLWAVGLAYLRGGGPEVKKLLAAKFLNRTSS